MKKVGKVKDHTLKVNTAFFKLNGKKYPHDPKVCHKDKVECIRNVPKHLENLVTCKQVTIVSDRITAIIGCEAYLLD